ncbi:hypothetical protein [Halodesulfovibrio spirochaetisodalis]|uniref:Uncharacterized protein n=1 Tax=Halodesulfovibrio spirochaetisodalis TaxID=1560234 RepID=A0A1B7XAT6_9BACT|nr:hypothetical protein [Halodesulfovibrio spirochaetisodalis]OBQ46484.1 hypothetical protein SP90_12355 [Halodesulfovibrio spirochaetisodalis]
MTKIILQLSAQYMDPPLSIVNREDGCFKYIEINELKVSDELRRDIDDWDEEFQDTLAPYPPDSCFPSKAAEQEHGARGRILKQRLQEELGNEYLVINGAEWARYYKTW